MRRAKHIELKGRMMTFEAEQTTADSMNEALDLARARLAEHGETAERAIRYHLTEAVCIELSAIQRELAALRAALRPSAD